ncbi:MAG: ion transporter [Cyclobacteriaceae bacterium]
MISRILKLLSNEWIIITAIVANSILLFLMGYKQFEFDERLVILDQAFTIFFVIELVSKIISRGWKGYISNPWNQFDFVLVVISIPSLFELVIDFPDISYLLMFRILRVLRILRFMRFIPNITKMFAGIARAFRASIFVFVALVIYSVLLAVVSSHLFRNEAPEFFGNPSISLYSIFQTFTMEGWNEIPTTIIENSTEGSVKPAFTRFFFFIIVLTGGIFGMSIMNAIFVDEMVMDNNDDLEAKVDYLHEKVDRLMAKLEEQAPPSKSDS